MENQARINGSNDNPASFKSYTINGIAYVHAVIPAGRTEIFDKEFYMRDDIAYVSIPDSVVAIGKWAFDKCGIETVFIPRSVTHIEEGAIGGESLQSIVVDGSNPAYMSEDGILFSKDKTVLLTYPAKKMRESYKIPDGVVRIGMDAFLCSGIVGKVIIPASVKEIGYNAFGKCFCVVDENNPAFSSDEYGNLYDKAKTEIIAAHRIDGLIIPKSVVKIDDMLLEDVDFEELVTIENARNMDFDSLYLNAKVYCRENSYGQTFAEENRLRYELLED
jgi:hypothetical protein